MASTGIVSRAVLLIGGFAWLFSTSVDAGYPLFFDNVDPLLALDTIPYASVHHGQQIGKFPSTYKSRSLKGADFITFLSTDGVKDDGSIAKFLKNYAATKQLTFNGKSFKIIPRRFSGRPVLYLKKSKVDSLLKGIETGKALPLDGPLIKAFHAEKASAELGALFAKGHTSLKIPELKNIQFDLLKTHSHVPLKVPLVRGVQIGVLRPVIHHHYGFPVREGNEVSSFATSVVPSDKLVKGLPLNFGQGIGRPPHKALFLGGHVQQVFVNNNFDQHKLPHFTTHPLKGSDEDYGLADTPGGFSGNGNVKVLQLENAGVHGIHNIASHVEAGQAEAPHMSNSHFAEGDGLSSPVRLRESHILTDRGAGSHTEGKLIGLTVINDIKGHTDVYHRSGSDVKILNSAGHQHESFLSGNGRNANTHTLDVPFLKESEHAVGALVAAGSGHYPAHNAHRILAGVPVVLAHLNDGSAESNRAYDTRVAGISESELKHSHLSHSNHVINVDKVGIKGVGTYGHIGDLHSHVSHQIPIAHAIPIHKEVIPLVGKPVHFSRPLRPFKIVSNVHTSGLVEVPPPQLQISHHHFAPLVKKPRLFFAKPVPPQPVKVIFPAPVLVQQRVVPVSGASRHLNHHGSYRLRAFLAHPGPIQGLSIPHKFVLHNPQDSSGHSSEYSHLAVNKVVHHAPAEPQTTSGHAALPHEASAESHQHLQANQEDPLQATPAQHEYSHYGASQGGTTGNGINSGASFHQQASGAAVQSHSLHHQLNDHQVLPHPGASFHQVPVHHVVREDRARRYFLHGHHHNQQEVAALRPPLGHAGHAHPSNNPKVGLYTGPLPHAKQAVGIQHQLVAPQDVAVAPYPGDLHAPIVASPAVSLRYQEHTGNHASSVVFPSADNNASPDSQSHSQSVTVVHHHQVLPADHVSVQASGSALHSGALVQPSALIHNDHAHRIDHGTAQVGVGHTAEKLPYQKLPAVHVHHVSHASHALGDSKSHVPLNYAADKFTHHSPVAISETRVAAHGSTHNQGGELPSVHSTSDHHPSNHQPTNRAYGGYQHIYHEQAHPAHLPFAPVHQEASQQGRIHQHAPIVHAPQGSAVQVQSNYVHGVHAQPSQAGVLHVQHSHMHASQVHAPLVNAHGQFDRIVHNGQPIAEGVALQPEPVPVAAAPASAVSAAQSQLIHLQRESTDSLPAQVSCGDHGATAGFSRPAIPIHVVDGVRQDTVHATHQPIIDASVGHSHRIEAPATSVQLNHPQNQVGVLVHATPNVVAHQHNEAHHSHVSHAHAAQEQNQHGPVGPDNGVFPLVHAAPAQPIENLAHHERRGQHFGANVLHREHQITHAGSAHPVLTDAVHAQSGAAHSQQLVAVPPALDAGVRGHHVGAPQLVQLEVSPADHGSEVHTVHQQVVNQPQIHQQALVVHAAPPTLDGSEGAHASDNAGGGQNSPTRAVVHRQYFSMGIDHGHHHHHDQHDGPSSHAEPLALHLQRQSHEVVAHEPVPAAAALPASYPVTAPAASVTPSHTSVPLSAGAAYDEKETPVAIETTAVERPISRRKKAASAAGARRRRKASKRASKSSSSSSVNASAASEQNPVFRPVAPGDNQRLDSEKTEKVVEH